MLIVTTEGKFEKNIAVCKRRKYNIQKLKEIIKLLSQNIPLPLHNKNHKLKGNYVGYWECHIEADWLLIYKKTNTHLILSRTGTHSDLF